MTAVEHIAGMTFHGRKGPVGNAFRYGVDYVLLDPEAQGPFPRLFGRALRACTMPITAGRRAAGAGSLGCGRCWRRTAFRGRRASC